ncbi:ABC transporter substrate-binding protein [Paucibacter sp. Y2R2-4]|uniref:ABC transporter substrate-binding protein n=1 Tax=Paucibacter sp. Y2R2-4 TaxID=2893553 RepID=UPI0021E44117|nr:ABC transporter substrate-binding protein [Paucibacter sp. Y2R2-4]MCV2350965.1 ABC transporter substrate-binding protein [Paucibacter sp. Y2R2-4]
MPVSNPDRRTLLASTAMLGLGTWVAGCSHVGTPKDTLVQAFAFDDIITLDPAASFEVSGGEVLGNTYERLVGLNLDAPGEVFGVLAQSWEVSADGQVFSFTLKPGLRFASGNALTAEDVVFSLQRAVRMDKTPAFILTQLGLSKSNVEEKVRQTGPLTLQLQIGKPFAPSFVLNCLTATVASVVDKRLLLAKAQNEDWGAAWLKLNHAGSGPWTLRDWRANEILVLERNEQFHGPKPSLARVIYRHVKEAATQRLLLEKGDVDIARNLAPQDLLALAKSSEIQLTQTPKGSLYYLGLNQRHPLLAKPEVREAFKWLVDYEAIGATLIKGIGVPHQNFLPLGLLGASREQPFRLDVDRARALLAKAGLSQGFKISMDVRTVQPVQGIAEAIQQTAGRAGIQIEIIPGDGKQVLTKYRNRRHELFIGDWGCDYWDPHTNADTFTRNPDNRDDAKNRPLSWRNSWEIPELTRQSDAAVLEQDPQRRIQMYETLQAEFRRSSPFVMIFQQTQVAGVRRQVQGFRIGPTSETTLMAPVSKA